MPSVEVSEPARLKRPGWRSVSVMNSGARISRTTPIGTLMNSTHRQEIQSVSMPPAMRPIAAPEPETAA